MSKSAVTLPDQGLNWFWKEVTPDVRAALSEEQQKTIEAAVTRSAADAEHADLRLHLGNYYLRILAGKERRNAARIKKDIAENPVFVKKNYVVIAIYWALTFSAALYAGALFLNLFRLFFA